MTSTNPIIKCPHCSHVTETPEFDAVCAHCGGVHDHHPQPNALGLCPKCCKVYTFGDDLSPVRITLDGWEGFGPDTLYTIAEMMQIGQQNARYGFLYKAVQEFYTQRGEHQAAENPMLCLAFMEGFDDDLLSEHAEFIAQGNAEMKELLDFLVLKTRGQVTVGDMLGLLQKADGLNRTSSDTVYS